MLVSDVIQSARYMLSDDFAGSQRWEDTNMLEKVGDACAELIRLRPDVLLTDAGSLTTWTVPTATSDAAPVDENWRLPLAHFVAASCLMEDGSDQQNVNKADKHTMSFARAVTGR